MIQAPLDADAEANAIEEAASAFASALGLTDVQYHIEEVGSEAFLKFHVGRSAPVYDHALRVAQKQISATNPFRGLLNLELFPISKFPQSLEANVLLTIITRETRRIGPPTATSPQLLSNVSVTFQNHEDQKLIQPATHVVTGRRGVGKSTLIMRAIDLLRKSKRLCVLIDAQAYSETTGSALFREVLSDFARKLAADARKHSSAQRSTQPDNPLLSFADSVLDDAKNLPRAIPELNRLVRETSEAAGSDVYLFLDDFHLLDHTSQPELLHLLHGALKGAGGWLKVAGLKTQLNPYDAATRKGLQVPGDAQLISLDFTLVDPEAAEKHLRNILERFLAAVGIESLAPAIHEEAFKRLVWANAGVPRDFLQMFARSLEQARRTDRTKVSLTDVNLSIGEFGQQKMDELEQDARNEEDVLKRLLEHLEEFCLEQRKSMGFLFGRNKLPSGARLKY